MFIGTLKPIILDSISAFAVSKIKAPQIEANSFSYNSFLCCPDCFTINILKLKTFEKEYLYLCNCCNSYFVASNKLWI